MSILIKPTCIFKGLVPSHWLIVHLSVKRNCLVRFLLENVSCDLKAVLWPSEQQWLVILNRKPDAKKDTTTPYSVGLMQVFCSSVTWSLVSLHFGFHNLVRYFSQVVSPTCSQHHHGNFIGLAKWHSPTALMFLPAKASGLSWSSSSTGRPPSTSWSGESWWSTSSSTLVKKFWSLFATMRQNVPWQHNWSH